MLYMAMAAAHTIRSRRLAAADAASAPPPAPQEFFEAGDYRQPGSLRLIQQIDQHVAERSNIGEPVTVPNSPGQISPLRPVSINSQLSSTHLALLQPGDPGFVERRQSRQPLPNGIDRRADRAYYNKDMGDLSDPYTQPARPLGESSFHTGHSRITTTMTRIAERDHHED